tara:strand:+ start:226 stop:771 length:546 start_codon:yes stop_codon:yes gene_type:complete
MHVGCDEDASCRDIAQDARCASRSCVRMGPCHDINPPARSFPGICVDSITEMNGPPNSPSHWEAQLVKNGTGQWSERLDALDRDAFFFQPTEAGRYRFTAMNLQGDPWCTLFEVQTLDDGHVWVNPQAIAGNDGGVPDHDTACRIERELAANERVVFLVEPEDLSFDFAGMDYTLFIERGD